MDKIDLAKINFSIKKPNFQIALVNIISFYNKFNVVKE